MREWLKEIFSFCAVENRLRVCLLSAIPPHRPTKRHFFLESMALIFAAAVLLLSACGEPTEKPAQISASQASGSIQFERVPGDKLDPALKRYQTHPWRLLKIPEFRKSFETALAGKKVWVWVRNIHVVSVEGITYQTPDGIAFLYHGNRSLHGPEGKPDGAYSIGDPETGDFTLVYLPAKNLVGLKVQKYFIAKGTPDGPPHYFGDLRPSIRTLLDSNTDLR